jgi:hypothetical protein
MAERQHDDPFSYRTDTKCAVIAVRSKLGCPFYLGFPFCPPSWAHIYTRRPLDQSKSFFVAQSGSSGDCQPGRAHMQRLAPLSGHFSDTAAWLSSFFARAASVRLPPVSRSAPAPPRSVDNCLFKPCRESARMADRWIMKGFASGEHYTSSNCALIRAATTHATQLDQRQKTERSFLAHTQVVAPFDR